MVLNPQVVEETTSLEDRPMIMLQCAYEENCLSSSANAADQSSIRRLLRFSSQIHNNGQSDFRPKNGHHSWVWHECHRYAAAPVCQNHQIRTTRSCSVGREATPGSKHENLKCQIRLQTITKK